MWTRVSPAISPPRAHNRASAYNLNNWGLDQPLLVRRFGVGELESTWVVRSENRVALRASHESGRIREPGWAKLEVLQMSLSI